MLCLAGPSYLFGQNPHQSANDTIYVAPNFTPGKISIKVSLLSPIEATKSLKVSVEIPISARLSLEPGFGYLYSNSFDVDQMVDSKLNSEQHLALRYYPRENAINGLYVSSLATFSNFVYQKGTWRNDIENQPDYGWYLDYSKPVNYQQTNYGVYALVGIQPIIFKHFIVDICGGMGLTFETTTSKTNTIPPNATISSLTSAGLFSLYVGYIF